MTLVASALGLLFAFLDGTRLKLFAAPSAFLLIGFGLAYDLKDISAFAPIFQYHDVRMGWEYLTLFAGTGIGLLLGFVVLNGPRIDVSPGRPPGVPVRYSMLRIRAAFWILALLALIGFLHNAAPFGFNPVAMISQMLLNPRVYEYRFGRSTPFNYLYFLNAMALCMYVFMRTQGAILRWHHLPVLGALLIVSMFQGTKFTVFDTVLLPLLVYVAASGRIRIRMLLIAVAALATFTVAFFAFVRGGGTHVLLSIVGYWLPGYYNLAHTVEQQHFQFGGFLDLLWPEKVLYPLQSVVIEGPLSFSLNPMYNMYTGVQKLFLNLWFFGPVIFFPILFLVLRELYARRRDGFLHAFLFAQTYYCFLFFFFFYGFSKPKYVFFAFIVVLIDLLCRAPLRSALRRNRADQVATDAGGAHG